MHATDDIQLGDHVLRLDGTVVEVLHRSGTAMRLHVAHLAVEAADRDGGLRLRIGVDAGGTIVGGTRLAVPAARRDAVLALFAEARRRRTEPGLRL